MAQEEDADVLARVAAAERAVEDDQPVVGEVGGTFVADGAALLEPATGLDLAKEQQIECVGLGGGPGAVVALQKLPEVRAASAQNAVDDGQVFTGEITGVAVAALAPFLEQAVEVDGLGPRLRRAQNRRQQPGREHDQDRRSG